MGTLSRHSISRLPQTLYWTRHSPNLQTKLLDRTFHTLTRTHFKDKGKFLWENSVSKEMSCKRYSNQYYRRTGTQKGLGLLGCALVVSGIVYYKVFQKSLQARDDSTDTGLQSPEKLQDAQNQKPTEQIQLEEAVDISRDILQRAKDEQGSPGMVIAVSVDGQTVWCEGIGYADVENRVLCTGDSVFRIASISKPITMAAVARLIEAGDLDLDKPVQHYVPSFPEKTWNGEKVTITTRQLVSHRSGIRHYDKSYMKDKNNNTKSNQSAASGQKQNQSGSKIDEKENQSQSQDNEFELKEYFLQKIFKSVEESLGLFKNDPLVHKPGTKFLYTSHGWTLVSAVVEGITKTPFEKHLKSMLQDLGMTSTYLDENNVIVYNRGRHYMKNKQGRLINTPYVDLSYKWAGGGLISTVHDVVKFGNIMLYSYQATSKHGEKDPRALLPGYLKPETMKMIFKPTSNAKVQRNMQGERCYGMGWGVWSKGQDYGCCWRQCFFVSHTGGAVGSSSVLLILPHEAEESQMEGGKSTNPENSKTVECIPPKGIVVSIITNMTGVGLNKTAFDIAQVFEKVYQA